VLSSVSAGEGVVCGVLNHAFFTGFGSFVSDDGGEGRLTDVLWMEMGCGATTTTTEASIKLSPQIDPNCNVLARGIVSPDILHGNYKKQIGVGALLNDTHTHTT
jgi:hypothetical protein